MLTPGWNIFALYVFVLFYKVDLLEQLSKCYAGFELLGMNACFPTVTEYMAVLVVSGISILLCTCYA